MKTAEELKKTFEKEMGYDWKSISMGKFAYIEWLENKLIQSQQPTDERHYFTAPNNDNGGRFCKCGKYMTDDIHFKVNEQ